MTLNAPANILRLQKEGILTHNFLHTMGENVYIRLVMNLNNTDCKNKYRKNSIVLYYIISFFYKELLYLITACIVALSIFVWSFHKSMLCE